MTAVIPLPNIDLPDLEDWEYGALCAEVGETTFYPDLGETAGPAKFLCRRCAVSAECLDFAFRHMNDDTEAGWWGVWGGTSERQRRGMLAAREGAAA